MSTTETISMDGLTTQNYPCGCSASGPGDVPNYCPEHGRPSTASDNADYPYLMPWDRRPAAVREFVARYQHEPTTEKELAWIEGYIACIEDLPR